MGEDVILKTRPFFFFRIFGTTYTKEHGGVGNDGLLARYDTRVMRHANTTSEDGPSTSPTSFSFALVSNTVEDHLALKCVRDGGLG